jgi:hypothetical protein
VHAVRSSSGSADRVGATTVTVRTTAQAKRSKSAVARINASTQRPRPGAKVRRNDRPRISPRKKVDLRSTDLSPKIESLQVIGDQVIEHGDQSCCSICGRRVHVIAHLTPRGSLSLRRAESGGHQYRSSKQDLGAVLQ